jgi:hypothetical protein
VYVAGTSSLHYFGGMQQSADDVFLCSFWSIVPVGYKSSPNCPHDGLIREVDIGSWIAVVLTVESA